MAQIYDATGNIGRGAAVDTYNRLLTYATTKTISFHSAIDGHAYKGVFSATVGAGDVFLYIKNTSPNMISIKSFNVNVTANEVLEMYRLPNGTPSGGTDIDMYNMNFGSTVTPTGVFQYGNDITGLTLSQKIESLYMPASNGSAYLSCECSMMLTTNTAFAIVAKNGCTINMSLLILELSGGN